MKIQYKLVILPEYNIIVSDEEIKGGYYYNERDKVVRLNNSINHPYHKKVIASENSEHNLPSINYNGLEEKYGAVSWSKYWEEVNDQIKEGVNPQSYRLGFKKAKELSDKKFSFEDMRQAFYAGRGTRNKDEVYPNEAKKIIQSLQEPKVFDIDVN